MSSNYIWALSNTSPPPPIVITLHQLLYENELSCTPLCLLKQKTDEGITALGEVLSTACYYVIFMQIGEQKSKAE